MISAYDSAEIQLSCDFALGLNLGALVQVYGIADMVMERIVNEVRMASSWAGLPASWTGRDSECVTDLPPN